MPKIGIVTGRAPSLHVVAEDISTVYSELGHQARVFFRPVPHFEAKQLFDKGIIFMPFDPAYVTPYVILQRDYRRAGIDNAFYTTIEGRPIRAMTPDWFKRDAEVIAVSEYVRSKLEEAEVRVLDVIHHGLDLKKLEKVAPDKEALRRLTGGDVVFGVVASSHRRKGLDLLAKAIALVQDKIGAGFYVFTEPQAKPYFAGLKRTYVDARFGKLDRNSVLRLIASMDFYVCSSLAEGFCLPVLEAQALGVPVIYPDYAPLNEQVDPRFNLPFAWEDVEVYSERLGIAFELHVYRPEALAERIVEAYELFKSNPEEYRRMGEGAKKHVRENFDARKLYPRFNKYLNL
jgi:glycosyltransferase involved in cell wall biosynthesis